MRAWSHVGQFLGIPALVWLLAVIAGLLALWLSKRELQPFFGPRLRSAGMILAALYALVGAVMGTNGQIAMSPFRWIFLVVIALGYAIYTQFLAKVTH